MLPHIQETHIDSRPKLSTDGRFNGGGQVPTVGTRTPGPCIQHQLFRTGGDASGANLSLVPRIRKYMENTEA